MYLIFLFNKHPTHSIRAQVADSVNSIITFDFDKELENIQRNITWVDSLLRNYSLFDTSKLALAENISAETTTAISEMLLTLNSRMELRAFDPMRNQIRNARNNFREWWVTNAMNIIEKYTEKKRLLIYIVRSPVYSNSKNMISLGIYQLVNSHLSYTCL